MAREPDAALDAWSLRLCRHEDVQRILEIRAETFAHFAPQSYSSEEVETLLGDVRESELREMTENGTLFVAEAGGVVIGCGGWQGELVRHMYVLPGETRRGVGSALLRALEADYQRRTGNASIRAGVVLYAQGFYEKNGYKLVEEAVDWDGSKYLRMRKALG